MKLQILPVFLFTLTQAGAQEVIPFRQRLTTASQPYHMQPTDQIVIHSTVVKEMVDKQFKLDERGEVNFPLIGRLQLSGETVTSVEAKLTEKLKKYYVAPDIEVAVTAVRTLPVSILGSVGTPGVHMIKEPTRLVDIISIAGGLRSDAGQNVIVSRDPKNGPLPHPKATTAPGGETAVTLDVTRLLQGQAPEDNVMILPQDVITIPAAQVVYVVGNVKKAGGFTLVGRPNLSVIQAIALAEGLDPRAKPSDARILRRGADGRQEIAVNVKRVLAGKEDDLVLQPNDILYVPSSTAKIITTRTIDTTLQMATGFILFH